MGTTLTCAFSATFSLFRRTNLTFQDLIIELDLVYGAIGPVAYFTAKSKVCPNQRLYLRLLSTIIRLFIEICRRTLVFQR